MKGKKCISQIIPCLKRGGMPNIGFWLSLRAWIWMLSSTACSIYSLYQPSDFQKDSIRLPELVAIFFPLSWGLSPLLKMEEMIWWPNSVMNSLDGGGIRGSTGISSGFRVGEPSAIWTILGARIGGSIDWVAWKASIIRLVFTLSMSRLHWKVSYTDDSQPTEEHLIFSASKGTLIGGSSMDGSLRITFSTKSSSLSFISRSLRVSTSRTSSLFDSPRSA